jgi:ribulose-phosphate 3-epimerase
MTKISVSILSKNDDNTILKINNTNADYFHIDAMDGIFVPEKCFSLDEIKKVSTKTNKKLDIHLMVENPNDYIENLSLSNIEYLTIHYEVLKNNLDIINKIKSRGIKCGVSVKPITDIKEVFYLLDTIDLILIMSVEPGYGGQKFLTSSLDKVRLLRDEISRRKLNTIISIDGGINNDNSDLCKEAGCDMLVVGTYVVNSDDYQHHIDLIR